MENETITLSFFCVMPLALDERREELVKRGEPGSSV